MIIKNEMFIEPEYSFKINGNYYKNFRTYSEYNYLGHGFGSNLKRMHFQSALKLTKTYFKKVNVIDFGCAGGCLSPSLSTYFNRVLGIDINPNFTEISQNLINNMNLKNVDVICNKNMDNNELKSVINEDFDIVFLLEVLEHVGNKNRMYKSKIDLLKEISSLIKNDGLIVISVPNMVRLSFMLQRIGFTLFGMQREELSWKQLIKASFLNNTDELEKNWCNGHLGFNHKKLEYHMEKKFKIIHNSNLIFQIIYVIKKLEG